MHALNEFLWFLASLGITWCWITEEHDVRSPTIWS